MAECEASGSVPAYHAVSPGLKPPAAPSPDPYRKAFIRQWDQFKNWVPLGSEIKCEAMYCF